MVKIINELGAGGRIGAALGSGFGEALGQLAQHKMQNLLQDKEYKSIAKTIKQFNPYLSETEAYNIARVPEARKAFFERGVSISGGEQQPTQQMQQSPGQQVSVEEKLEPRTFEFGPTAEDRKEQSSLRKGFLQKHQAGLKSYRDLSVDVKKALQTLEKSHKDNKLPGWFSAYWDPKGQSIADPNTRYLNHLYKKIAGKDAMKNLVTSGSRAGKSFLDLSESQKAAVYQPYETQKELLNDILHEAESVESDEKILQSIKKKHKGQYPLDLVDQFNELKNVSSPTEKADELASLPEGSQIRKDGKILEKKNNEWIQVG